MATDESKIAGVITPAPTPIDPVSTLEEMQQIPKAEEPTPPWWVLHLLWPLLRGHRVFRAWSQRQDNTVKLAICRWLGVLDAVAAERRLVNGLRKDLDATAGKLGELIPEFNKNQVIVGDLRLIHLDQLRRIQEHRKRDAKEPS